MSDQREETSVRLPYAMSISGRLISIADVPSGAACDCKCPGCGRRVIAKKGDILTHHFAHEAEHACVGAFESMAHLLAKQIISDAKYVHVPAVVGRWLNHHVTVAQAARVELSDVRLEPWEDSIRPDIMARAGAYDLAIEVFVTHLSEPRKIEIFRDRGAAAIEIDLSQFRGQFNLAGFEDAVLWRAPRWWLFNATEQTVSADLRSKDEARQREARARRQAAVDKEREYQRLWEEVQARQKRDQEAADVLAAQREAAARRERLIALEVIVGPDVVAFVDAMECKLSTAAIEKLGNDEGRRWVSSINPRRVLGFQSDSWGWLVDYEKSCHEILRMEVFRRSAA